MTDDFGQRAGLRRLLARFLFASIVAGPAAVSARPDVDLRRNATTNDDDTEERAADDELDDDAVERAIARLVAYGDRDAAPMSIARLLDTLDPFDATRTAALAALSPHVDVRRALATALASRFRLVGDMVVLDHLQHDADASVRAAAERALDGRVGVLAKWPLYRA